MADLEAALEFVLQHEDYNLTGKVGMDNNGFPVRFGINKKFHMTDVDPTFWSEDTMDRDTALQLAESIYTQQYWGPIQGEQIQEQTIANKLLDMAVNMGPGKTIRLAQTVVNVWKQTGPQLTVDGKMGPLTLAAINGVPVDKMYAGLRKEWQLFIEAILEVHPEWENLRNGWIARANA